MNDFSDLFPAFSPVENGESGDLYDIVRQHSLDCNKGFHILKENEHGGDVDKDKKSINSGTERATRRRMISCLSELKSLLPPENEKKRRKISTSELLWKATDYISHLQGKVDGLTKKKADMKMKGVQKSCFYKLDEKDFPMVNVSHVCLDVLITTDTRIDDMVLSKLIASVEEQGLQVLTASSFTTHDRITHTLTCKVCHARSFHGSTKLGESIWNLMRDWNISSC
ncbi:transcription factor bHLH100 isoform X2 [Cryptomeria japonica]|uniref:transcription factor bHLH100 isoform X2 n=1 Tax=Cryptomeria japonica TaxID=3369 RepID=UPI0027DA9CCF|nr:transcription factor bHLH100 isoform X2 [Cryptomeria japonica]